MYYGRFLDSICCDAYFRWIPSPFTYISFYLLWHPSFSYQNSIKTLCNTSSVILCETVDIPSFNSAISFGFFLVSPVTEIKEGQIGKLWWHSIHQLWLIHFLESRLFSKSCSIKSKCFWIGSYWNQILSNASLFKKFNFFSCQITINKNDPVSNLRLEVCKSSFD